MNIRSFVLDLDVRDGETKRMNCPSCGGNNTFTVHNDMGSMIYNCYRLNCGLRGAAHGSMSAADIKKRMQSVAKKTHSIEPETMTIPLSVIEPSKENVHMNDFKDRWGLHDIRILFDIKDKRAVFPIYYKGRIIDAVGRSLAGAVPKWLRYTGRADVYTHCTGEPYQSVVIVEDVISAIVATRVSQNVTGMAILGTSLSPAHMQHISKYSNVIIALDPDAAAKTLRYKREVESWTGIKTHALPLHDDIKYSNQKDMDNLRQVILGVR